MWPGDAGAPAHQRPLVRPPTRDVRLPEAGEVRPAGLQAHHPAAGGEPQAQDGERGIARPLERLLERTPGALQVYRQDERAHGGIADPRPVQPLGEDRRRVLGVGSPGEEAGQEEAAQRRGGAGACFRGRTIIRGKGIAGESQNPGPELLLDGLPSAADNGVSGRSCHSTPEDATPPRHHPPTLLPPEPERGPHPQEVCHGPPRSGHRESDHRRPGRPAHDRRDEPRCWRSTSSPRPARRVHPSTSTRPSERFEVISGSRRGA
jgi:hypothetical protein